MAHDLVSDPTSNRPVLVSLVFFTGKEVVTIRTVDKLSSENRRDRHRADGELEGNWRPLMF